jgi:hypothetical protein
MINEYVRFQSEKIHLGAIPSVSQASSMSETLKKLLFHQSSVEDIHLYIHLYIHVYILEN